MKPMTSPHPGPIRGNACLAWRRSIRSSRPAWCVLAATLFCAAQARFMHAQAVSSPAGSPAVAPPATASSATASLSGPLTGQLRDSSGALIPGARVELRRLDDSVAASTLTDNSGQFRIAQPAPGDYRLTIVLSGFEPLTRTLHIGRASLAPLALTMQLASVSTNVTINAAEDVDVAAPDNNKDSATISSDDMKSLPIFDGDVVATLSAFLDAGVAGEGGTTLVIDGVESKTVGVAPSAIERVSVNQDPYSAQYRQPGKGQVEIVTKSTADKFHGSASFTFRDSALNGTNYFATVKPPEQRRIYEGYLTGPIHPLRDTTFLFSINRQEEDLSNTVNAIVQNPANPTGPGITFNQNIAAPTRNTSLTMKAAHQINDHHSSYFLYRFYDATRTNQNVGGLTLPAAGYIAYNFDMDLTFHDDLAFAPNKFNQFSILFERNIDRTVSDQAIPSIVVQGAFAGGGAQNDSLQTENNPNISDMVSWTTHRIHQLKFGVQLPNLGRRILEDLTNRQGTYTFASLAAYQAATPATYTLQQGQTRFLTHFDQPGAFFMDTIQATSRLTITPGVRYDFQNALPGTMDAILPRLSLAYVLDKKHAMVVRVGSGIYMRRVGVNIGQQLARYQYAAERSLLLTTNISYPVTATQLVAQPPSLFNFEPNLKAPMQDYFSLSVERQLTKKSTVTVSYDGYRGWHALRSIDINAPLPPFTNPARPNPNYAQVLQLQSGGTQKSDSLSLSYRGRISNVFSGFMQYTYQHADSNTEFSTFIPENQFAPNAEWSRTNFDQRQRLNFFGTFYPDKPLNLGIGFYNYTPLPYSITTGTDAYLDGLTNARPSGVPRNSLNGGDYQDVQVRLGYTRKVRPHLKDQSPTLALSLSSFNTLNRVNFGSYVGVITSPDFMKPTTASDPRRLQLAASYNF
jgi:Carboxypeptidase regulatory-like domain/TonB dependent receptor